MLHVRIHLIMHMIWYFPANEDDGYFGQEQVPLTDEIKEILEEYPDGQIFKVCNMKIIIIREL